MNAFRMGLMTASIALLELFQWRAEREDLFARVERLPVWGQGLLVLAALFWLGAAGNFAVALDFLYFGF